MKCYESRITCSAESGTPAPRGLSSAREAAAAFESLLFAQTLKPLSQSLGFFGDVALDACAEKIARSERDGLTERLERLFSSKETA